MEKSKKISENYECFKEKGRKNIGFGALKYQDIDYC